MGCDGRLWIETAPLVHQLKQQARDGTISEVLQLPLIGWRVKTETRPALRNKREVDDYGSGDDEYYDQQYDDDDYEDYATDSEKAVGKVDTSTKAIVTTPVTSTSTESTTVSSTTTEMHPHRHHHGESKPIDNIEPEVEVVNKPPVHQEPPTVVTNVTNSVEDTLPEATLPMTPSTALTSSTEKPTTLEKDTERTGVSSSPTITYHSTVTAVDSREVINQVLPDKTSEYDNYDDYDDEDDEESETIVPDVTNNKKIDVIEIDTEEPVVEVTRPKITTTETPEVTSGMVVITDAETIPRENPTTLEETIPTTSSTTKILIPITVPTTASTTTMSSTTTTTVKTTTQTEEEHTTLKQTTLRHITSTPRTTVTVSQFTESIEYEVKNFPPTIQNRLKRLPVTAGKMFSYVIPENTFTDMEDGTNLLLEFLSSDGQPVKNESWCQFNPRKKEIYGL